jgi:hypothetical protein
VTNETATLPEPPIAADVCMRGYEYMPLEVLRLRDSTLAVKAPPEAFRAAVLLWCAAWHQVPAGSLPDDDRVLARLAQIDNLRTWKRVREWALHGFSKCSDSRFYHHLICLRAAENWVSRGGKVRGGQISGQTRRRQAAEKQQNHPEDTSPKVAPENEQLKGRERKGKKKEGSVPYGTDAGASSEEIKDRLFGSCLDWLKKHSDKPTDSLRALIGKWIKTYGDGEVLKAFIDCHKEHAVDPIGWITKTLAIRLARTEKRQARDKPLTKGVSIDDAVNYQGEKQA